MPVSHGFPNNGHRVWNYLKDWGPTNGSPTKKNCKTPQKKSKLPYKTIFQSDLVIKQMIILEQTDVFFFTKKMLPNRFGVTRMSVNLYKVFVGV